MGTIFTNSKNCKTFDPHRQLLCLTDKIDLIKMINMLFYQVLAYKIHGKV